MDLSEILGYLRVTSNQEDGRQDKVSKTRTKSYHQNYHPPIRHRALNSLSEPLISDYTHGKVLDGTHQIQNTNGASVDPQKQFLDRTYVRSGNPHFVARKVGPLYRKYCDTGNSYSEDVGIGNSKKVNHSENSFSEIPKDGAKQRGIQRTNPKMTSRPEIRFLNESYVTSALAAEDDKLLPLSSKSQFVSKSNGMEKVGQVSATLPPAGISTVAASWKNYRLGFTNSTTEPDGNRLAKNQGTSNHINAFSNDNSHSEIGAQEMKLNKASKKYEGLEKLKDKIKRQQLACKENKKPEKSNENETIAAADDQSCMTGTQDFANGNNGNGCSVVLEEEPYTPVRTASRHCGRIIADNKEDERHVKVRKIATNVSSPSYRGFTNLKGKPYDKSSNATTSKVKSKLKETKVDSTTNDKVLTSTTTSNKCDRKTNLSEPVVDKNKIRRKDMITPSSWRDGQETIRRLLGPAPKVTTAKTKSFAANQEEISLEESKLTVGARQMLKDLQLNQNLEVNNITTSLVEEKNSITSEPKLDPKPEVKPRPHAVKRKPASVPEPDKAKVRHYDPEEIRKFMAKQKDERSRKAQEDKMAVINRHVKRQEMLQEVYRKQKEATAAQQREVSSTRCKSRSDFAKSNDIKDNQPDFDLELSVDGSSDLHLNFSDASSTLTGNSQDSSTPHITPRIESAPAVPPMRSNSFNGRLHANSTYPRPMSQNLDLNSTSWKTNHPTVAAPSVDILTSDPASYLGQIEMSNRRRIMDIHSSAATLTTKLREIYRQTSVSDSIPQTVESQSPSHDSLAGSGPTYVGTLLDDNMPGVQSLRLKAQEIYEKKEQDAATRIQAVYRGYNVRKNLKWQYITGLPDIEDQMSSKKSFNSNMAPSGFQTNSYQDQSDTSSVDCGLAAIKPFDLSKTTKFRSLFHQHLDDHQKGSQNHSLYTNEVKEHKPQPRSSTLYPKYPWEDAASDQFSIVNIFTSKYKGLLQTDSDHSSDAPIERHIAKLHSPAVSPISSTGSSKKRLAPPQQPNCTEVTSDLAKSDKAGLFEAKENKVRIPSEKKNEALFDDKEVSHAPSENLSSHIGATRSKSSHTCGSRRAMSARKKLNLFKAPTKPLRVDSLTDSSLQSFSDDSEINNHSTSEAPLRSQSSIGDSTDSDVSSLLNEQAKIHVKPSHRRPSNYSNQQEKDATGPSMANKRYAPQTLPMRLRAELYNFEQTVETVSLAQQETFSLGQIFQNQQEKQDQELHYWDRLKHAVNLLEGKTAGPTSQMPEHSEALMSGDQSFSLKSITAREENPSAKHDSYPTRMHTRLKVIPSTMESNTNLSESLYSQSHSKHLHSSSTGGKYSISTSQTESKRRSHRKNFHQQSSHRESHHSDDSSSSRCSVKTASDVRVGKESSDSITEDISDGSIIETGSVSMSTPKQSHYLSSPKEVWKVQLEEEKRRAQKEDAIWQRKLKEVEEKLNSLQHPSVKKELDEVLPLVVLDEVPRMMAELRELTHKQESSRREHYKRVKSLLRSQAKNSEGKSHRSRDSSKSDSEIYEHPKRTKEHESSHKHGSVGDMPTPKQKCLAEKKLEIQALEKRLQHEEKYLHKLKKETLKKCNDPNVNSRNNSSSLITSSIKEDFSEHREKQTSRRRLDNFSHSSNHSISEVLNATSASLPASVSTALGKGHSHGSHGDGKSSISEEIQASNSGKSRKQYTSVNESSIAEDFNSHTRNNNSSYSKKTKPSASESGDDTGTNDEYSRSFETSISSSYRASPVRQLPQPLVGARNGSLSFKSSRSSRGKRRGSESDTEDSFQSETLSDASDIEVRIRALSEDLRKKKVEADKLRHEKKAKHREKLKAQEESLIKQIEAYDNYIECIRDELQKEQEPSSKKGVKPQIKQPKVSESRKFKQRSTTDVSPTQMSKRDSTGSSADETLPSSPLSPTKNEFQPDTSICSGTMSPQFQATSKADVSKQSSLFASHVQQSSPNEVQNTTTEIKTKSIPEEFDEKTLSSDRSISVSGISKMTNKESFLSSKEVLDTVKSDLMEKSASRKSSLPSTKTAEESKNEDKIDSENLGTDKSIHLTSPVPEISESISENIESMVPSSALRSSNNDKVILKLNLNEEEHSSQPVHVESEAKQSSKDSVKAKEKPEDSTSVSEQYSEDFEADKTISSHSQSFDDLEDEDKSKYDEISQYSLDKTVSEVEQGDEISEEISVHSDTSARTSPSKSITISNSPRGASSVSSLHNSQVSIIPELNLDKEHTETLSNSELQENVETSPSVKVEQQPLQDSEDVALKNTSRQVENVVDELLNRFVSQSISTICKIKKEQTSVKKAAPPVLPKPKRKTSPDKNRSLTPSAQTLTDTDEKSISASITTSKVLKEPKPLSEIKETSEEKSKRIKHQLTNDLMESLLADSIKKALDVRHQKIDNAKLASPVMSPREIFIDEQKITTRRQSSSFDVPAFSLDDDPFLWSLSPDSESSDDFPAADCDDFEKTTPRPRSPLPNETKPSLLSDDIAENIWPDLIPHKPPPPYPGHDADASLELQKLSKEFYAVPQKREEIDQLVSSAVEKFWLDRTNGQSLSDTAMPDCFLTVTDDLVSEMDQQSCKSYKKMLFDLTREIIEEVYQGDSNQNNDGNNNNNPAKNYSSHPMTRLVHRKCQPVINKYYRQSRSPPSTPEELQKVVQDAVAGLLQMDNSETGTIGELGSSGRRQDFDKWKTSKKDHVDRILIQELQEEEPQWVDYDADVHELKVQLTNTIFDSLISKTVEIFKNIYKKRNQRQQQQQVPL